MIGLFVWCLLFFLSSQYLSDDQRAVFAGRWACIALAFIMNDHGFHRLCLSITQPGGTAGEKIFNTNMFWLLIHSVVTDWSMLQCQYNVCVRPEVKVVYIHSSGVLRAWGRLFARLLVYLFIVIFVSGVWFFTGGWIICHLIWGANVIHCTQLLGQSRQVLKVRRWKVKPGSKVILSFLFFSLCWDFVHSSSGHFMQVIS